MSTRRLLRVAGDSSRALTWSISFLFAEQPTVRNLLSSKLRQLSSLQRRRMNMHLSGSKRLMFTIAAVVLMTGLVAGLQTRRVDQNALKNADKGTEWLTYGRTHSEQRYSPLNQINATNVATLV